MGKKIKANREKKVKFLQMNTRLLFYIFFSQLIICSVLKAIIENGIEKALEKFNTLDVYQEQGTLGRWMWESNEI